jgi:hypothetical protein
MPFAVAPSAAAEIRQRLQASGLKHPVASLADLAHGTAALKEELRRGASEHEILDLARRTVEDVDDSAYWLEVLIYERDKHDPDDLFLCDGLPMAIPIEIREALTAYRLTYDDGRFLLEGPRVFANLRSLGNQSSPKGRGGN